MYNMVHWLEARSLGITPRAWMEWGGGEYIDIDI